MSFNLKQFLKISLSLLIAWLILWLWTSIGSFLEATVQSIPTPTPANTQLDVFLLSGADLSDTWVMSTYGVQNKPYLDIEEGVIYKGMAVAAIPLRRTKFGRKETRYMLFQDVWEYQTEEHAIDAFANMVSVYKSGNNRLDMPIKAFKSAFVNYVSHCTKDIPHESCQFVVQEGVYLIYAATYIGEGIITEEDWGQAMMAIQAKLLEQTSE